MRIFMSSRIGEFLSVRRALHDHFNGSGCEDYEAYLFECSTPGTSHVRDHYLAELSKSDFAVFVLGNDIGPGTLDEYTHWHANCAGARRAFLFVKNWPDVTRLAEELSFSGQVMTGWDESDLPLWVEQSVRTAVAREIHEKSLLVRTEVVVQTALHIDAPEPYRILALRVSQALVTDGPTAAHRLLNSEIIEMGSLEEREIERQNIAAFIERRSENFVGALKMYEALSKATGRNRFQLAIVVCHYESGDLITARELFDKLSLDESPLYGLLAAMFALEDGDADKSLQTLLGSSAIDRYQYNGWSLVGACYHRQGRHMRAAAAYQRAARADEAMWPIACSQIVSVLLSLFDIDRNSSRLLQLLAAIDSCIVGFNSRMVRSDKVEEFQRHLGMTKATLQVKLGQTSDALEAMESHRGTVPDNLYRYNISLLRNLLFDEAIDEELFGLAAAETGDIGIWSSYSMLKVVKYINKGVPFSEIESCIENVQERFHDSYLLTFLLAIESDHDGNSVNAITRLQSIYVDPSVPFVDRLSCLNFTFVIAHRAGALDVCEFVLADAQRLQLWSLELLVNDAVTQCQRAKKLPLAERKAVSDHVTSRLRHLTAALLNDQQTLARNRGGTIGRFARALYRLWHAARIFPEMQENLELVRSQFHGRDLEEFDRNLGAEMAV